jgi:hypothetical protein
LKRDLSSSVIAGLTRNPQHTNPAPASQQLDFTECLTAHRWIAGRARHDKRQGAIRVEGAEYLRNFKLFWPLAHVQPMRFAIKKEMLKQ